MNNSRRFLILPIVGLFLMLTMDAVPRASGIAGGAGSPGDLAKAGRGVPTILATDIGDDIDDTWALALLLRSPELDLKLVVTDYGKPLYRAKVAAKLLDAAGRSDVPIGLGPEVKGVTGEGGQADWVRGYDLAKYPGTVKRDGVQALIDLLMGSKEPITLICIGPLPTIAAALEREPWIAEHARFVGMDGSVRKGYGGKKVPDPEWNIKANIPAAQRAFTAVWPMTITPLDTCGLVSVRGEKYAALRLSKDPLARALLATYRVWLGTNAAKADRESTMLFDTVAVYLALSKEKDFCVMENLMIRVTDDGFTRIDPAGKAMDCAMEWKDLGGFEDFLVRRIGGGVGAKGYSAVSSPEDLKSVLTG
jgi:inosine-uridine nucleoside N-ribohydrolase